MVDLSPTGLSEQDVQARLVRLDELLERMESVPGPQSEMALEAVEVLTEVYGTALARIVSMLDRGASSVAALTSDQLVSHLLLLHNLHPEPVEERVVKALTEVEASLGDGADVRLTGITDGVARVSVSAGGCQSSAGTLASSVSDVVLAAAPELAAVNAVSTRPVSEPALIPVESLLRRPSGAA